MKISSTSHAAIDYIYGVLMVASPWLYGFDHSYLAIFPPVINGAAAVVMSFFTNYEGGLVKLIPLKVHFAIDLLMGILLVASPWLLEFNEEVFIPHVIMGALEIAVVLKSDRNAYKGREYHYNKPYITGNIEKK